MRTFRWLPVVLGVASLAPATPTGPPSSGDPIVVGVAGKTSAVLVRGRQNSTCRRFNAFEGRGTVDIGDFTGADPLCIAEVAVFQPGQAMQVLQPVNPWKDGSDPAIIVGPVVPLPVALNVWVVGKQSMSAATRQELLDQVAADLVHAVQLFDQNRVGITLDYRAIDATRLLGPTSNEAGGLGDGCMDVGGARALGGEYYKADRLNVYYVETISMPDEEDLKGYTCFWQEAPNIIYVSWDARSDATLAHELAHAFGLQAPASGHTTDYAGFDERNLMWTGLDDAEANARDHLTLGQAYRMNVDARSFVNAARGSLGPLRRGIVKVCQCTAGETEPCPKLSRDPSQGGGG